MTQNFPVTRVFVEATGWRWAKERLPGEVQLASAHGPLFERGFRLHCYQRRELRTTFKAPAGLYVEDAGAQRHAVAPVRRAGLVTLPERMHPVHTFIRTGVAPTSARTR